MTTRLIAFIAALAMCWLALKLKRWPVPRIRASLYVAVVLALIVALDPLPRYIVVIAGSGTLVLLSFIAVCIAVPLLVRSALKRFRQNNAHLWKE